MKGFLYSAVHYSAICGLMGLWAGMTGFGNLPPVCAEEPWSVQGDAPTVASGVPTSRASVRPAAPDSFVRTGCYIWLMAYQKGFGRLSSSKCPMKPSCSNYSLEAINRYGGFWGILMTADRLFHEGSVRQTAPWMVEGDRTRFLDPVDDNVCWRTKP